jgi:hypothetical protein
MARHVPEIILKYLLPRGIKKIVTDIICCKKNWHHSEIAHTRLLTEVSVASHNNALKKEVEKILDQ